MIKLTQVLVAAAHVDTRVCLTMVQRTKSRLKITLEDGREAGLFLPRGHILHNGALLASDDGVTVEVVAAKEQVSTIRTKDPTLLARACYHLGNRHVPLQVEPGWCRYQHDPVLDEMVKGLGLEVVIETASFQPEAGAYGGTSEVHTQRV